MGGRKISSSSSKTGPKIFSKLNGDSEAPQNDFHESGEGSFLPAATRTVDKKTSDPAKKIFEQLVGSLNRPQGAEDEELPTTVVFRSSISKSGSREGSRDGKPLKSGFLLKSGSACPKPPRAGKDQHETRSPRVGRSQHSAGEMSARAAICHEFSEKNEDGKRAPDGADTAKKTKEAASNPHEALAEKLRDAGLHGESLQVRRKHRSKKKDGENEESDSADDASLLAKLRGDNRLENDVPEESGGDVVTVSAAGAGLDEEADEAPFVSVTPKIDTKAGRELRIKMRKEEEARIKDLLSPVKTAAASLKESPGDSYTRLKAKIKASLNKCEALSADTKKAYNGVDHIEDEYKWWDGRISTLEYGGAMASADDEVPSWDEVYTTVCTPALATPSRCGPREYIEVEEVFAESLGGGPVNENIAQVFREAPVAMLHSGHSAGRKRGVLKR